MSAPKRAGETERGENVLSTTKVKLCFLARIDKLAISATSNKGLLTVSQYITLVSRVIAASTISIFVMSTKVVLIFPSYNVIASKGERFLISNLRGF